MPASAWVYILASRRNGTLYIGVTTELIKRIWQHREDLGDGFTKRYGVHSLVYYERHLEILQAIRREKRLKRWKRSWKLRLIEKTNPDWRDLWSEVVGDVGPAESARGDERTGSPPSRG